VRGWLGVGIQDLDQDLVKVMNLPNTHGVLVSDVQKDGPAAKAGLKQGDVIVSVDDREMDSTGRLRNTVASAGAGKSVSVDVIRDGKKLNLQVKLGELSGQSDATAASPTSAQGSSLDGLTLENLNDQTRGQFRIAESVQSGVVVAGVKPSSDAASSGLRPGDVILELNRNPVKSVSAFADAYKRAKGRLLLLVSRDGPTLFLVLKR
jgi:S1-C subfamily serine protease